MKLSVINAVAELKLFEHTHTCAHTHTHVQKTESPSPRVSVRTRKMADCVDEDFVFPVRRY